MENKKIIVGICAVVFCAVTALGLMGMGPANELATGVSEELAQQEQQHALETAATKDGYTDIEKWQQVLEKQKKTNLKLINKGLKSSGTAPAVNAELAKYKIKTKGSQSIKTLKKDYKTIKKIVNYSSKIAKKQKSVSKSAKKCLKKYKKLLTSKQKKKLNTYAKQASKTYSIKQLKKMDKSITKIQKKAIGGLVGMDVSKWSAKKIKYVKKWGARNNAYLSGTRMAGLGYYIAHKAYDHNCEPRLLCAIARIESGCGAQPYHSPYNAYG